MPSYFPFTSSVWAASVGSVSVVKGVYTIDFMLNNIVLIHLIKWEAWYLSVNIFRVKEENKSPLNGYCNFCQRVISCFTSYYSFVVYITVILSIAPLIYWILYIPGVIYRTVIAMVIKVIQLGIQKVFRSQNHWITSKITKYDS